MEENSGGRFQIAFSLFALVEELLLKLLVRPASRGYSSLYFTASSYSSFMELARLLEMGGRSAIK